MSGQPGKLYIVATPIGNLDDITLRAVNILKTVDFILVEDTRHSKKLLSHIGSNKPVKAYHDHNEREISQQIIDKIQEGNVAALISDAGTPLINDPGYHLVSLAHKNNLQVVPIPGPCALIAALSSSGLATDKFSFLGFTPTKTKDRKEFYSKYVDKTETLVFYESTHRLMDSLQDAMEVFGADRNACLAREVTKHYEDIRHATLEQLIQWLEQKPEKQRGEFVLMIQGVVQVEANFDEAVKHVVSTVLKA